MYKSYIVESSAFVTTQAFTVPFWLYDASHVSTYPVGAVRLACNVIVFVPRVDVLTGRPVVVTL